MAKTMTAGNALNIVAVRYPRLITDGFGARFVDEVQSEIWHRYPWRESLSPLAPFHLIVDEQDYGAPLVTIPTDFWSLYDAVLYGADGQVIPLKLPKVLGVSIGTDIPAAITYQKANQSFRVYPRSSVGGAKWWVAGEYKKIPTKITNENVNSQVLPWDDLYFSVFRLGLVWVVKRDLIGSPREVKDARDEFNLALYVMAQNEGMADGQTGLIYPDEGLELGG